MRRCGSTPGSELVWKGDVDVYSRYPRNPSLQQFQKCSKSASAQGVDFNQTKFNQIFTLKVTLREAQRLNSTRTCSVVVPGCTDNFFLTGHTPPSRRPFLEEVVNDRGKYSIEFNVNVYLNLP